MLTLYLGTSQQKKEVFIHILILVLNIYIMVILIKILFMQIERNKRMWGFLIKKIQTF